MAALSYFLQCHGGHGTETAPYLPDRISFLYINEREHLLPGCPGYHKVLTELLGGAQSPLRKDSYNLFLGIVVHKKNWQLLHILWKKLPNSQSKKLLSVCYSNFKGLASSNLAVAV